MDKIDCALGIAAHNEEANIGHLLERLLDQELQLVQVKEIIVIASGCSDDTENIVREFMRRDPRIRLLVQENREGKASAINLFLKEQAQQILMISSADLLPAKDSVEKLILPFANPEMGLTSGRPIPVNNPGKFMGFAAHMLWHLHHDINLRGGFKAGEMIAFRKVFERIPHYTAVDEASIEPLIRGQGYQVKYIPDAVVANKGPETVADFLRQRRRIYAGHLEIEAILGYAVSTMKAKTILSSLWRNLDWRPKQFLWTWAVVALEIVGRFLGWCDFRTQRNHTVWDIALTTKELKASG